MRFENNVLFVDGGPQSRGDRPDALGGPRVRGEEIRVNAVAPTVVMTPLVQGFIDTAPDPAEMRERLESYNPMPGIPESEDIASVVAFLASDDARWITGVTIPIDGGYTAR